jgi:hypothetical protein
VARTFYRIVRTDRPTIADFTSNQARGLPAPDDPDRRRLWDGLSCYNTETQARRNALKRPSLGRYIAELQIPEDGPVRYERTPVSAGHHTLWGDAVVLLRYVASVSPV